jgi:GntR family transcriptional regulator
MKSAYSMMRPWWSTVDQVPDWDPAEYIYLQLADELAALIRDGTYPPGSRLPSEQEIGETWEVSKMTTRRALDVLRERKLIKTLHGRGSFVATQQADDA